MQRPEIKERPGEFEEQKGKEKAPCPELSEEEASCGRRSELTGPAENWAGP